MGKNSFYVTTAIDYPNGPPHMGHAYEKVVADAYARWYRLLGRDVRFLTGTDENGQNLVKRAQEQGAEGVRPFIDQHVLLFQKLCRDLQISNDDFIRTTEERHRKQTHALWDVLEKKGDIFFDRYKGHYCFSCESFYLESQAPDLMCPQHHKRLEFVEEDGFFFRMSAYADWIKAHIEANPSFIYPASARREILSRLDSEPLKDLSVSRPQSGWGITVPSNPQHVVYTWFDALINYLSAVSEEPLRSRYWPADMHVIGKDITWFHTVIWPIMLQAAGLPIPLQVYVHGMILGEDGRKMSKSLGNGVGPYEVIDHYPLDVFRYYLLRSFTSGTDGSFVKADLKNKNNHELANEFGNLLMRLIKLTEKRVGKAIASEDFRPEFDGRDLFLAMCRFMEQREHSRALDLLWEALGRVNAYLNIHEPWRIKDDDRRFREIMFNGLYLMHCVAVLIGPFLPNTSARTLDMLGSSARGTESLEFGKVTFQFGEPVSLFPKME